jgi:hypothetical protein
MARFHLEKWYVDVVDPTGRALVGYSSTLRWAGLEVRHASLLLSEPGRAARAQTTLRRVTAPEAEGDAIAWSLPLLGLEGRWSRHCASLSAELFSTARGAVVWTCHAPRAAARVRLGGVRLEGTGYVEQLRLTLAPWRLPIEALHWGRAIADSCAVIWIDWRGADHSRRLVAVDDSVAQGAELTDDGVTWAGTSLVRLGTRRTLREGTLGGSVATSLPAVLRRRLPARLLEVHEHKWVGQASIRGAPANAIWEVVRWPASGRSPTA